MERGAFSYHLPSGLIAQRPLPERRAARLLCLHAGSGRLADHTVADLPALLAPGDLLVVNDTRVIPARLAARKPTGGRVEILVERALDGERALAHLGAGKPVRAGMELVLADGGVVQVLAARGGGLWEIAFAEPVDAVLAQLGRVPLPPYIRREPEAEDAERYQTLFAERPGAVAAPTAGLHFDGPLLAALARRGVRVERVTLHVGAGTFQPIRAGRIEDHRMHAERFSVPAATVQAIRDARAGGGRVVAVGTTVVRALESAVVDGELMPRSGETALYITPGYGFRIVDALLTNFHLPESTLLVLVCAFAGRERVLAAYRHAVAHRYRFFSYGDAMFIERPAEH